MRMRHILVFCALFATVSAGLAVQVKNVNQAKSRSLLFSHTGRQRNSIRGRQSNAFSGWQKSKTDVAWKEDNSIKTDNSASPFLHVWPRHRTESGINREWESARDGPVMTAQVSKNEAPSLKRAQAPIDVPNPGKEVKSSAGLSLDVKDGGVIDHNLATERTAKGEVDKRDKELRFNSLAPPLHGNRPAPPTLGYTTPRPKFAQGLGRVLETESKKRGPRLSQNVPFSLHNSVSSIFPRLRSWQGGDEETGARGGSEKDLPKSSGSENKLVRDEGDAYIHPPALGASVLPHLHRPFLGVWRSEIATPPPSVLNIRKSQLSPTAIRGSWESKFLALFPQHNGYNPNPAPLSQSIPDSTGGKGDPAVPDPEEHEVNTKAVDQSLNSTGQSAITSPLSLTPEVQHRERTEETTLTDVRDTIDVGGERGRGGRVRRSVDIDNSAAGADARGSASVGGIDIISTEPGLKGTSPLGESASTDSKSSTGITAYKQSTESNGGHNTENSVNGTAVSNTTTETVSIPPSSVSSGTTINTSTTTSSLTSAHDDSTVNVSGSHSSTLSPKTSMKMPEQSSSSPKLSTTVQGTTVEVSSSPATLSSSPVPNQKSPETATSTTGIPSSAASDTAEMGQTTHSTTRLATDSITATTPTTSAASVISTVSSSATAATQTTTPTISTNNMNNTTKTDTKPSLSPTLSADTNTLTMSSSNNSVSTLPQNVTQTADSKTTQTVTTAKSMTASYSKFDTSKSSSVENKVSPTEDSHKRTARSTESSNSSTQSFTMETGGTTTISTTASSTSPTSTTPLSSSQSTPESVDLSSTKGSSPSTQVPTIPNSSPSPASSPSTSITPEDLFGDMWTAEPEPYPENEPYPEPGGQDKGDRKENDEEEEPSSEPGPDWVIAKMVWQEAWEVHLYVFACLFGCLGVYTLVCVLRLWRIHRLLSRRYFVSLNLLMLLLCATRAVYLSVDGYNSNGTFHPSLDYFFYSISFPCLTSAFSIQLYALLQATKMQFLPPTIQKMSVLATIVVVHFVISIVTDVIVGMYAGMEVMLFVCQLFFILWGLFLFFGYAYIFRRLYLHAVKRQKNVVQQSGSTYYGAGSSSGSGVKPKSKFTLSVAVKVTFSTAILGLVTVGLELYAVVGVYKTFSDDRPEPWPWYLYHTALRLVEFLMCATMSYVASQPFRYRRGRQACCCPVLCAPCAEICCCGADVNRSDMQAAWSDLDHHQQLRASIDRGLPPHHVSYLQDGGGPHSKASNNNGSSQRQNGKGGPRKGGGEGGKDGGGGVTPKASKIYFSNHDDVRPIVTSQPASRPTSTTSDAFENHALSVRGSVNGDRMVGSAGQRDPSPGHEATSPTSTTPLKTSNGVVNTAFLPVSDDVHSPGPQSPDVSDFKSRKSSIASSEFFLGASVSLADSMASELDKAFRSMHEDDEDLKGQADASPDSPKPPPSEKDQNPPKEPAIKASTDRSRQDFPQDQHHQGSETSSTSTLRRSQSALGRCSFSNDEDVDHDAQSKDEDEAKGKAASSEPGSSEAWHQKLFRSRSDNPAAGGVSGVIRTKDVAKATYMSLLDIERQQQQQRPHAGTTPDPPVTADGSSLGATSPEGCQGWSSPRSGAAHTVTCVDGGELARARADTDDRCGGDEGEIPLGHVSTVQPDTGGASASRDSDCAGGGDGRERHPQPSPPADVNGGTMTSSHPPYRTVISVQGKRGGGRDRGRQEEEKESSPPPPSSPPTTSSVPPAQPFASPHFPAPGGPFHSKLMTPSKGLLDYGDGDDDIEV